MLKRALSALGNRASFRFVYLSTLAADPRSRAKCVLEAIEAERLVLGAELKGYVFRAGPIIGRGDELCSGIADRAARAFPFMMVWGYGDTTLQPIHVVDLGRCIARAFKSSPEELRPGVYSVAGTETVSVLELMDMALARMGKFKLKFHIPGLILRLAALARGEGPFREKLELMSSSFLTNRNDALSLLGPHHGLRTLEQTRDEVMGVK
jgi:nucleoside-diphosphate-sugar epimerase